MSLPRVTEVTRLCDIALDAMEAQLSDDTTGTEVVCAGLSLTLALIRTACESEVNAEVFRPILEQMYRLLPTQKVH